MRYCKTICAIISCLMIVLFTTVCSAQKAIKIMVYDSLTSESIPFAQLEILSNLTRTKFASTDGQGIHNLELAIREDSLEVFTIYVRHLSYENVVLDLFVVDLSDTTIVRVPMRPKEFKIGEITLLAKRLPYVIKGDTVIYDVQALSRTFDDNLEATLKRFPGVSIAPDGSISYENKTVQKVLIDGQIIQNGSAAMITRSLSSDQVASVEIRLNEQDDRIVGSILERKDYLIMDIKLKKDVRKSFFGKGVLTNGFLGDNSTPRLGGMTNIFSLSKMRIHLLGEVDGLGEVEIPLTTIRNLGIEESQFLHSLPASFDKISSSNQYREEFYPFRNYTNQRVSSIGLSIHRDIGQNFVLSVGSYNSKQLISRQRADVWGSLDTSVLPIALQQSLQEEVTFSKNRLALSHYTTRVHTDLTYTLVLPNESQGKIWNTMETQSIFDEASRGAEQFLNISNEVKIDSTSTLTSVLTFMNRSPRISYDFTTPETTNSFSDIWQPDWNNIKQMLALEIRDIMAKVEYKKFIGMHTIGVGTGYISQVMSEKADFLANREVVKTSPFALSTENLKYRVWSTNAFYKVAPSNLDFSLKLGLNQILSPDSTLENRTRLTPHILTKINWMVIPTITIDMSYERDQRIFHLSDILLAPKWRDIQNVVQNNFVSLSPIKTEMLQLSGQIRIKPITTNIQLAYVRASSFDGNTIQRIIGINALTSPDNNRSAYELLSIKFVKEIVDNNIMLSYEGGLLKSEVASILEGTRFNVNNTRYVHNGIIRWSLFDKSGELNMDFRYYKLLFGATTEERATSNNLQVRAGYDMALSSKFSFSLNSIYYNWDRSQLYNVDIDFTYKMEKHHFRLSVFNLMNNEAYQFNSINNISFNRIIESVMPRSFRLSYSYLLR